MADQFTTYDKAPIVGNTITIRAWRFAIRELILAVLVVVLLVLCIILSGFLGNSSTQLLAAQTSAALKMDADVCRENGCLKTAAYSIDHLNMSVQPCENFFEFACGGFRVVNPLDDKTFNHNVLRQINLLNRDRLIRILKASPDTFASDWSSERKMKNFFSSCLDDFRQEQLKANPFIQKVLPILGGWYVLGTWNENNWNMNNDLKVVQSDLWVDALWTPLVTVNQYNKRSRVIAIYPAGTSVFMSWKNYNDPTKVQLQNNYKKFMRTVATLLARDAGISQDQSLTEKIAVFVDDAFRVEQRLALIASNSRYQSDPYANAKQVSLDNLTSSTGNVIDWTAQMTYLFADAGVTGSTNIILPYPEYVRNLTSLINGLNSTTRSRSLHNYLMWRVLETYVQDLSWEYVHANRVMLVDAYGYANFLGTPEYCFLLAKHYFDVALGVLYVQNHFDKENKDKVTDITEAVKQAIENMISTNQWMDEATKKYAINKMRSSTYKIGYPDFMDDRTQVDGMYSDISINASDFFGNVLAANQHLKREWNQELQYGEDRSKWIFNTYDTNLAVYWYWDEVIVPAGILQFPVYQYQMPHYYTFGSLGTLLGHFVHHLIDEMGRRWDSGGDYMSTPTYGWWSNDTNNNYNAVKQCVIDLYNNATQGPYVMNNGDVRTVAVNGKSYAGEAIAITTGIRLAYNAYHDWQAKYGVEKSAPGLPYTPDQLFFIGHAQTHCYNRDPLYKYLYAQYNGADEDTRVNLALSQLEEFSTAFNCKPPQKMAPTQRCTYY